MASSLAAAVSESPAITAPAWPMRRPRGADIPDTNATSGFDIDRAAQRAASTSCCPPISPIITTTSVSSSASNASSTVLKSVPFTGSPPMPTQVDWPRPSFVICETAS